MVVNPVVEQESEYVNSLCYLVVVYELDAELHDKLGVEEVTLPPETAQVNFRANKLGV